MCASVNLTAQVIIQGVDVGCFQWRSKCQHREPLNKCCMDSEINSTRQTQTYINIVKDIIYMVHSGIN